MVLAFTTSILHSNDSIQLLLVVVVVYDCRLKKSQIIIIIITAVIIITTSTSYRYPAYKLFQVFHYY